VQSFVYKVGGIEVLKTNLQLIPIERSSPSVYWLSLFWNLRIQHFSLVSVLLQLDELLWRGAQVDTGYTVKRLLNDNMQNNLHSDTLEESHTRGMGSTPHHSRHITHHSTPCRTFLCFIVCYLLYTLCEGNYSAVPWISVVLTFYVHTGLKRKSQENGFFNNKASSLLKNHPAHVQKVLVLLYWPSRKYHLLGISS
jgi:hypothetical protein